MDNHADNFVSNFNYFAGLLDSDGSVYSIKRKVRGDKLRISPKISFTNTNLNLIELFSNFLHNNNINHYVCTRDRKTVYKLEKTIEISRISKCMEFANIIMNYCVGRRLQLSLMEEYCRSRSTYVEDNDWKFSTTPYTHEQIELTDKLINLNYNYNIDDYNNYRNYTYSWLGGFIDGDGSIFISSHKQGFPREDIRMEPTISFSGESTAVFNNIKEIFNRDSIKYTETKIKCKTKRKDNNKSKFYYNLAVKNQESLDILVEKLENKIFGKSKQLSIIKEYLYLRAESPKAYTDRCFKLCEEITLLNK